MATIRAYKCTRNDGTDFYSGTVDYGAALVSGTPIEIDAEPANGRVCGRGLHVCNTLRKTIRFTNKRFMPYRWFGVDVDEADVVEQDSEKMRTRRLRVILEFTLADVLGPDFDARIEAVRADMLTWVKIPWLKPAHPVEDGQLGELFAQWHAAITPWLQGGHNLSARWRVVRDWKTAADAAAASAASAASAAADAVAADAAAAVAADAAADAAVAADAAAAAAVAADAAADAASVDIAASAAAAAADASAAAAYTFKITRWRWYGWWRWYLQPRYVLWRHARWRIAGMEQPNPWEPLVRMYRFGAMPIGYVQEEFVIYLPQE